MALRRWFADGEMTNEEHRSAVGARIIPLITGIPSQPPFRMFVNRADAQSESESCGKRRRLPCSEWRSLKLDLKKKTADLADGADKKPLKSA